MDGKHSLAGDDGTRCLKGLCPFPGQGEDTMKRGRKKTSWGRRNPCKSIRGIIYVEDTRGGMDQHCGGTRLSYKHILLATLRPELLAWLGLAKQEGGKSYCLQPQGSCAYRGRLPPLNGRDPGPVGYSLQQAQEEMNNMMV